MTRLSAWPFGDARSPLMGFRPDSSSSRTTPKAYTSILSVTFPYIKYSGARYPNVPTTSLCVREVELDGAQIASPKSDSYHSDEFRVSVSHQRQRDKTGNKMEARQYCINLRLELVGEKDVGRLDVPVDRRPRAARVHVAQRFRDPQRRLVPVRP
jgi:hypothetical protein